MAVNPSIPLQFNSPQLNFGQSVERGLRLKDLLAEQEYKQKNLQYLQNRDNWQSMESQQRMLESQQRILLRASRDMLNLEAQGRPKAQEGWRAWRQQLQGRGINTQPLPLDWDDNAVQQTVQFVQTMGDDEARNNDYFIKADTNALFQHVDGWNTRRKSGGSAPAPKPPTLTGRAKSLSEWMTAIETLPPEAQEKYIQDRFGDPESMKLAIIEYMRTGKWSDKPQSKDPSWLQSARAAEAILNDPNASESLKATARAELKDLQDSSRRGSQNTLQIDIRQPGDPMPLGKKGSADIEEQLLENTALSSRLYEIRGSYKPQFQKLSNRFSTGWSALKEKLGADLSPTERKDLQEYSNFRRSAINNLNEYIKQITGAAMSIPEAERITKAMPNPGQGLFDGDSPTEFEAKLNGVIKQINSAIARQAFIKREGMTINQVPLDRMNSIINKRAKELMGEMKKKMPGSSQSAVEQAVKRQVAAEFGLIYE